jgi:peptidoglycan/xylan/chitin deacetylase (PgdA/CDA1 family)
VYWTVDAHDWEESTGVTASEVTDRIISNLRPGNIYLMHVGDNITGEVLDSVFTMIEDKGYKIVSLTEGL